MTHNGETVTRAELDARANRRARMIAASGVSTGDFAVIALPNGIEFFETTFALWKLGAVPCPVSPKLPEAELRAIVELIAPKLIIGVDPGRLPGWPSMAGGIAPDMQHTSAALPSKISPCWKAVTSGGSTGRPKVIVADMPGAASPHVGGYLQRFEETVLTPGPMYHNAGFKAAHQCLFSGGHVISMERFDAAQTLELIERYRVGYVVFVPTMMNRIWRLPVEQREAYDLSSLNVVLHLAAACPRWLKERWIEWLGAERIFEVYGGTEGIGHTAISGPQWLTHPGSVGQVGPGAELCIMNEQGVPCPPGEVGEVFFRAAPGRKDGYHYIGATANRRGEWESLGDLGHLDHDGYLYLADRRTDMIISGGVNIYPLEVEAALEKHADVRASVVIGLPDDDLGQRVHAIVQLSPDAQGRITAESLLEFLKGQLVRYKIPRTIEFVTDELRDEAGKTRRMQLREQRIKQADHCLLRFAGADDAQYKFADHVSLRGLP